MRIIEFSSIETVLSTPKIPAAPSIWPMFVLKDPTMTGLSTSLPVLNTLDSARASIRSPAYQKSVQSDYKQEDKFHT